MRVVLDANVLLAGLLTHGVCERLLDICWEEALTIVVICSEHILSEFGTNAESKFGVPPDKVAETVEKLRHRIQVVEPTVVAADSCRDLTDLPVLGTAVAGRANYLVTGDKDLLVLKSFQSVPIVSPREFYDLIHADGSELTESI